MLKPRRAFFSFAACLVAATLAGCGFHLRGSQGETVLPFKTMYVSVADTSSLGAELKRHIRASGDTETVADAKSAEAILDVLTEAKTESTLTLNSKGQIRELALYYTLRFKVRNNAGKEFIPATDITLKRELSFNEAVVLAKEGEKQLLYRDMQSDLVQQVMRRLAAIKPGA